MQIEFVSLQEYLVMMEHISALVSEEFLKIKAEDKKNLVPVPILYFASAVSDFFIPYSKIPEHKIQSRSTPIQTNNEGDSGEYGPPVLNLELYKTPKLLKVVREVAHNLKMITFKLETDASILNEKVLQNFEESKSDYVVGNLLQDKDLHVILFERASGL